MYISKFAVVFALVGSALAAPIANANNDGQIGKRATARSFAELTISSGKAGNAAAEARAKFPTPADLSAVSADDLEVLKTERETAEAAETEAFNPAIDDTDDDATKQALQNGKIKNKVLKLTAEVLALQIEQAQGKDVTDKLAEEQAKLQKNIQLDQEAAGQASQTVEFDGDGSDDDDDD